MAFTHLRRISLHILLGGMMLAVPRAAASQSRCVDSYENPIDVSLADPAVLKDTDGKYYVYGTGFACYYSTNLLDWRTGNNFGIYKYPAGDTRRNFWAPEVIKRASDGKYLMFYTAQPQDGRLRIYLAQSDSPTSAFYDVYTNAVGAAVPLFDTEPADAWLDAHPFVDTDGQAYLYATKDCASGSSQPGRGAIYVLSLDMESLTVGTPVEILPPNTTGWEVRPDGNTDIEGPYIIKHNSQYFLLYSGNGYWAETYALGYAVSSSPTGPFVKCADNPVLTSGGGLYGPGHCSATTSPDGKEHFLFYHSKIKSTSGGERQLCIDRINFVGSPGNETMEFHAVKTSTGTKASWVPQMLPSGVGVSTFCPAVEPFNSLDLTTWHFMGDNPWQRSIKNGALQINASSSDVLESGTSIGNLPLAYVAQDAVFQVTLKLNAWTPVLDDQRAFVTIWKDQQNFVRLNDIYAGGRKFRVLKEEAGVLTSYDVPNTLPDASKWLRIRKSGQQFSFSVSPDGETFTTLLNGGVDGTSANWALDRQLQIGLGAVCPSGHSLTAIFDEVRYDRLLPYTPGWDDAFNNTTLQRQVWLVHNEDQTHYELTGTHLRIRTQAGAWANARTDLRNVFLQSVRADDWVIGTKVQTPDFNTNNEQAFLIVAKDADNYLKCGPTYMDGATLEVSVESNGVRSVQRIANPWGVAAAVQLRITKVGTAYACEASNDGNTWISLGTQTISWTPLFVGLGAASPDSSQEKDCTFDWFRASDDQAPNDVIFVDTAATGSNTGTSWADAFTNLQDAIASPLIGMPIWVAAGTYTPGTSRTDSFTLKANLELYGGFTSGMTALTQRDWNANPSILSGEIQQDADPDNNAYHVVTAAANARLDGFTITAGSANGATPNDKGGALYVSGLGTAAPVLANCLFAFNKATSGGGIYNNGCSVQIFDSIFAGNAATDSGGGMYNAAGANPIMISNCVFRQNTAAAAIENRGGGAMYNVSVQKLTVTDCRFIGNQATGTGFNAGGGAMYSNGITWSTFVITNCVFAGNSCVGSGGGAVRMNNSYNLRHDGCVFSGNSSMGPGGAFGNYNGSTPVIAGCVFAGNVTTGRGGALEGWKGFDVRNSLFVGNKAGDNNNDAGGAVCRYGGGGPNTFANCTFSGNWAKYGGAIKVHIDGQPATISSNCIFWNNIASVAGNELYGDTNTVNYCDVTGGWTGAGTGNQGADPLFASGPAGTWTSVGAYDAIAGQTVLTCSSATWTPGAYAGLVLHPNMTKIPQLAIATNTADTITVWGNAATLASIGSPFQVWDYHLKSKGGRWTPLKPDPAEWIKDRTHSPCIDAGDPVAAFVLEPQKNGGRLNIGCYGNTAQASMTLPNERATIFLMR